LTSKICTGVGSPHGRVPKIPSRIPLLSVSRLPLAPAPLPSAQPWLSNILFVCCAYASSVQIIIHCSCALTFSHSFFSTDLSFMFVFLLLFFTAFNDPSRPYDPFTTVAFHCEPPIRICIPGARTALDATVRFSARVELGSNTNCGV